MKAARILGVAALLALLPRPALAADIDFERRVFGPDSPHSPAKGEVAAKGPVTLDSGEAVAEIELRVTPGGGRAGRGYVAKCKYDAESKTWSGTASDVPTKHEYDVYAVMTVRLANGKTATYYSRTVTLGLK